MTDEEGSPLWETLRVLNNSNNLLTTAVIHLTERIKSLEFILDWELNQWRNHWADFVRSEEWEPAEPGASMPVVKRGIGATNLEVQDDGGDPLGT